MFRGLDLHQMNSRCRCAKTPRPLWVISGHFAAQSPHVCFTPISDRKSGHRPSLKLTCIKATTEKWARYCPVWGHADQEGKTMACSKCSLLLVSLLFLGTTPHAHAQGTQQNLYGGSGSYATRPGGYYGGGGIPTGRGPLSQPIPPAASTINPYQNRQYYYPGPANPPERYWSYPGATPTYPSQHPFGR